MKVQVMKYISMIVLLLVVMSGSAQRGDELLVYAVKGKATIIKNNQEVPLKVGNVIKPGTSIKTDKDAKVTLVCKQGKPLSVNKEGVYPVTRWKDSCRNTPGSVTSNYFQYIWSELYRRSDDYKDELDRDNNLAVVRGENDKNEDYPEGMTVIEFPQGMDTLNYTGEDFPLSWISYTYKGKYQFSLYNFKDRKLIYKDSIEANEIFISRFKNKLKPGKSYTWAVSANANTGPIRRRVINYVPQARLDALIASMSETGDLHEDSAARYFRIGYLLEKAHYLAAAHAYYKMAANAGPDISLYTEKLSSLRFEYRIDIMESERKQ